MTFFIVQKPTFIDFNTETHTETVSLKSKHQILSDGVSSNSALVKLKNGTWCIRYGKHLLELKEVDCKNTTIGKIQNNSGKMVENVKCKWVLQNNASL